jgi:hypothetical protein
LPVLELKRSDALRKTIASYVASLILIVAMVEAVDQGAIWFAVLFFLAEVGVFWFGVRTLTDWCDLRVRVAWARASANLPPAAA